MRNTKSIVESAFKKLEDQEYYESFQLLRTALDRFGKQQQHSELLKAGKRAAMQFASKEQYELTVDIGIHIVKIFQSTNGPMNSDFCDVIISIGESCPPYSECRKHTVYSKALKLIAQNMKSSEYAHQKVLLNDISETLHLAAGEAFVGECQYGSAQNHYVFCSNSGGPELLACMMESWQKQGYISEYDLFPLRCVLILIYQGEVDAAERFLSGLPIDIHSDVFPGAGIQLAYFLIQACKAKSLNFYNLVKNKYQLVLRRDPSFDEYLEKIEVTFFQSYRKNDLAACNKMINNLLGGLVSKD